ncbi:MAG: RtcB family protein [Gammaproteobacteria bacterium]
MQTRTYEVIADQGKVPIKSWTRGVAFDESAKSQLREIAALPFIYKWIAVMPDVHLGKGATIGSVVPTLGAVIPAAVGVDIGCGMMAVKTDLNAARLPDDLSALRAAIECAVPHGSPGKTRDPGAWDEVPADAATAWQTISAEFERLKAKHPILEQTNNVHHLGTLGSGNHFIEVCLDESDTVWLMLHSGSRGVGNRIGQHFIALAKKDMERWFVHLPNRDLAYLPEGTEHFDDYIEAVEWAQNFARLNREVMMRRVIDALSGKIGFPFNARVEAVNCHHNYVARENHYGSNVWVTRKGAVRARPGDIGIIPGSMGERSYIVRGLGNDESFCSCSHGAGRVMSRTEAAKRISLEQHAEATRHVECRKDAAVIDESPAAYKPIDRVMEAQRDLVEVLYELRQVVCIKG